MAEENDGQGAGAEESRLEEGADTETNTTQAEAKEGSEASEEAVTPESLASELGWSPKDKWRGNPDDWKPAGQFLRDTVNVNKTQRRELKSVNDKLERLSRATSTIVERARAEERSKWEQRLDAAVDEGDKDMARRATAEIAKIDRAKDDAPTGSGAAQEFVSRNAEWYNVDPIATQMAINVCEMNKHLSPEEQIEKAEAYVRKRFPEYFDDQKAKPGVKPPAEVAEQKGRTARTTTSREKGFADLPPEAKTAALRFEKQGVKKEDFAKEYWKENA